MKWCVVIPTFNNGRTLENVLYDVLQVTRNIIVVNDGSTDHTEALLEKFPGVNTIHYTPNRGKGHALQKGFERALELGFEYAITLDSDGQHFAKDIPAFIKKGNEHPNALIVGARTLPAEKLSRGSGFANKFSNFWFRIISGVSLPDTQSGFRLYPIKMLRRIRFYTTRYEFELEILIRAAWRGIPLMYIPISVFYPPREERVSHYRPFRDFGRISLLNTLCFLIAFLYIKPFSFLRYLRKENIRDFLKKNVTQTSDSDEKLSFSVMLGIFMGIVPIWGYQLVTAIALAYLLRLNKLIVIVAANISIPPMIPLILYLSYVTGGFILSVEDQVKFRSDISLVWVKDNFFQYMVGATVFAVVAAIFLGLVTFVLLKMLRKKRAILN